jgi:peptidyl-prolyl cis-trans isomerase D
MATLQKIRNKAGLLAIIIGLALFAFIIGDFLNSGSSLFRQSQKKIAKIGDYTLEYEEYEARIQEMEDVYKIQTGQSSPDESTVAQLRESVFENIVREKLLDQQAEKLGIAVTGKEVFAMINGANVHPMIQQLPIFTNPQTGRFDRTMMLNFLRTIQTEDLSSYPADAQEQIVQLKKYWLFWENTLKYARLEEKINALLSKAVQANSLDAKASFDERSTNINMLYTCIPYTSLSDADFKVSDSDLKKRYKSQIERFAQKPFRSARYVLVNVTPSKEDYNAVEKKILDLEKEFNTTTDIPGFVTENSDDKFLDCYLSNRLLTGKLKDFVSGSASYLAPVYDNGAFVMAKILGKTIAPDSVKAKRIVLSVKDEKRADSLLTVLRNGGDFDQLARTFSQNQQSPEMGWFREVDAIAAGSEFVRACFSATLNNYFIVKSKNIINIVQVTDKTAPVSKTKLALVSLKLTPSSQTYSSAYNKLNLLVAKNLKADEFFALAQKSGYEVFDAQVVRPTDYTLGNIPQMRQAVRFVHSNDLGKVSNILENQSNQFVVVGVTAVNDGDYLGLEIVKPVLTRELTNEFKAEKIINDLKAKRVVSLQAAAAAMKTKVDSALFVNFSTKSIQNIGEEPALIAAVSSAPLNKLSEPIKGKNGVYMFQVISNTHSQEPFNLKQELAGLSGMNSYRVVYQSFEAVRKAAKVKDSRIKFY